MDTQHQRPARSPKPPVKREFQITRSQGGATVYVWPADAIVKFRPMDPIHMGDGSVHPFSAWYAEPPMQPIATLPQCDAMRLGLPYLHESGGPVRFRITVEIVRDKPAGEKQ